MNGGLISYICLRCHLRRKRHARAGSGIGAKCRTECFRGELRIRFRLDLRLFLCVDGRTIPRACFRRAADICRDNRAIQSARQRNRCARELRIEASYIARGIAVCPPDVMDDPVPASARTMLLSIQVSSVP